MKTRCTVSDEKIGVARFFNASTLVPWLAVILPILLWVFFVRIDPRPYYVQEADIENGFYYWSRLVHDGLTPPLVSHPGTPIITLGSWLISLTSPDPEQAQLFFNVAYCGVAVVTTAALAFFFLSLRRADTGAGIIFLCLASVLCWPSALTYLNHFGSDSFTIAIGLTALLVFWLALKRSVGSSRLMALSGFILGFGLAAKITFLPLVASVVLAAAMHGWRTRSTNAGGLRAALALPVNVILAFLLFTASVWPNLPDFFLRLAYNSETRPDFANLASCIRLGISNFCVVSPLLLIAIIGVGMALAVCMIRWRSVICVHDRESQLDVPAAMCFLSLGLAALLYTSLAAHSNYRDPGHDFRNAAAAALVIPFAVLFLGHVVRVARPVWMKRVNMAAGLLGAALLLTTLPQHLLIRHRFIVDHSQRAAAVQQSLREMIPAGEHLAVWDGSPADLLGPASFHFWGNYRYANDAYDNDCLTRFAPFTWFRLREIRLEWEERDRVRPVSPGLLQRTAWKVKAFIATFTSVWTRSGEIVTGERQAVRFSWIAVPEREVNAELGKDGRARMLESIRTHFSVTGYERRTVAGDPWIFVHVAAPDLTL